MDYILDGYNIIHAHPYFEKALEKSLEASRQLLINVCEAIAEKRGDFKKILIVFDGNSKFNDLPPYRSANVETIYTESREEADDRIIDVLEARYGKRQTVVSNDNYVANHAREYKAKYMRVEDFLAFYFQSAERTNAPSLNSQEISNHDAREVTEAYKKHLGL